MTVHQAVTPRRRHSQRRMLSSARYAVKRIAALDTSELTDTPYIA
jgi:hypothetical protein